MISPEQLTRIAEARGCPDEMRVDLFVHIKNNFGTQAQYAADHGVSTSFVSCVLRGKKAPPSWMLDEIGYKKFVTRIVAYRKVD